ncbi:MAG: iron complex transport system substrate-binding protein [Candidatus Azotimanducaceae bacterium]
MMRYQLTALLLFMPCQLFAHSCHQPAVDSSRVAVAGGSVTELIYFLGEEHRLVAVDRTSNYPKEARLLPQVGYVRALSTEGMLSLEPTLLMGEEDMGPPEVLAQLERTGVEMVRIPEAFTPQGVIDKLRCVAEVLAVDSDRISLAETKLAASLRRLEAISFSKPEILPTAAVILVFSEGAPIAAGTNTAGDGLIQMAGMRNALSAINGWKPLSAESLIEADPEYLILTNRAVAAAGGMDKVYENPAIRLTTAGRKKQLLQMDGMTLLGFGPRTLDAAATISAFVRK